MTIQEALTLLKKCEVECEELAQAKVDTPLENYWKGKAVAFRSAQMIVEKVEAQNG